LIRSYWQALSNEPFQQLTHPYTSARIRPHPPACAVVAVLRCCTAALPPHPSCRSRPRRDLISAELDRVTSAIRTNYRTATLCLQSTFTLSVTVAGLRLNLFPVRPGRPLSDLVVVRCSGQLDRDRLLKGRFTQGVPTAACWSGLLSLSSGCCLIPVVSAPLWHTDSTARTTAGFTASPFWPVVASSERWYRCLVRRLVGQILQACSKKYILRP
jgi:hypothetical protein